MGQELTARTQFKVYPITVLSKKQALFMSCMEVHRGVMYAEEYMYYAPGVFSSILFFQERNKHRYRINVFLGCQCL